MKLPTGLLSLLTALALAGCERDSGGPAVSPPEPPSQNSPKSVIELQSLTPLLPNHPTHIAVDPLGNIFWCQESDDAQDVLLVIGQGGIARATQLSSANILHAMKVEADGASGHIQSVAAGEDGLLYFYFVGGRGMQTYACLGQFNPLHESIRVLAGTDRLMAQTGTGASIELARGSLLPAGAVMWLWLRHPDRFCLLRFSPKATAFATTIELEEPLKKISRGGTKPVALTRDTEQQQMLVSRDGSAFVVVDTFDGALWRIDSSSGDARLSWSLVGLPQAMSAPAQDAEGRILVFAAATPVIEPRTPEQITEALVRTEYPALLIFDPGAEKVGVIGPTDVHAYASFPVKDLRLGEMTPERKKNQWVSYDASSGELVRVRLKEAK